VSSTDDRMWSPRIILKLLFSLSRSPQSPLRGYFLDSTAEKNLVASSWYIFGSAVGPSVRALCVVRLLTPIPCDLYWCGRISMQLVIARWMANAAKVFKSKGQKVTARRNAHSWRRHTFRRCGVTCFCIMTSLVNTGACVTIVPVFAIPYVCYVRY